LETRLDPLLLLYCVRSTCTYISASQLHKNKFRFFTFNNQYHAVIGFYGANEMEMTLIDEIIETAVDVFAAAQKVIQAQPQDRVSQRIEMLPVT